MSLSSPQRDLDTTAVWDAVVAVLAEITGALRGARHAIRGLGIATARHTLIVENAAGQVIFASGNDDLRAAFQGAAIDAELGAELMQATGHGPALIFWPGKLRWIDEFAPAVHGAATRILTLDSWLVRRLTGESASSLVSAAETGALRLASVAWATAYLPAWAVRLLPPIEPSMGRAGGMTPRAAELTGVPVGLPVALGQPDTHAAEFGTRGAGLAASDLATAGWSATVVRPAQTLPGAAGVWRSVRIGDGYLVESDAGDAASGYGWLRGRTAASELTDAAIASESAAEQGIFALTGLRVMRPRAPSLGVAGLVAPLPFVTEPPGPGLLGTAILEDVGFALRANRARLDAAVSGAPLLRITGGYVGAPAAPAIFANALHAPVAAYPNLPAAAVGAAACAAVAAGDLAAREAAERLAPSPAIVEPDRARAADYDRYYQRWLELRRRLEAFVQDEA